MRVATDGRAARQRPSQGPKTQRGLRASATASAVLGGRPVDELSGETGSKTRFEAMPRYPSAWSCGAAPLPCPQGVVFTEPLAARRCRCLNGICDSGNGGGPSPMTRPPPQLPPALASADVAVEHEPPAPARPDENLPLMDAPPGHALRLMPCLANSRLTASSPRPWVVVSVSRASWRSCFQASGSR